MSNNSSEIEHACVQYGDMCLLGSAPASHMSVYRIPSGIRITVTEAGAAAGYTLDAAEARALMESIGRALERWSQ